MIPKKKQISEEPNAVRHGGLARQGGAAEVREVEEEEGSYGMNAILARIPLLYRSRAGDN